MGIAVWTRPHRKSEFARTAEEVRNRVACTPSTISCDRRYILSITLSVQQYLNGVFALEQGGFAVLIHKSWRHRRVNEDRVIGSVGRWR